MDCFSHLCGKLQDGSISVWRRMPNQLTYSLLGLHKVVPPPSRVNNNATISLLCAAASAWVRAPSASHVTFSFPDREL